MTYLTLGGARHGDSAMCCGFGVVAMKTSHVWIVEIEQRGKWVPCGSMYFTKRQAKEGDPDEKFRVRKYVRSSDIASGVSA